MLALVTAALAADDGTSCPATPPTDLSEALASYDREGYAVVRSAIDADLLAEVRQHVEHLFARYPTVPPEHLHHLLMRNDPFWIRLASDPRLLRLADEFAPFIDGDVALFASHYFCKMPHAGKAVLWHQDGSYWPLRPMNVLTLYLAVDDADEENGCLQIVPGSHRWDLAELTNSSRDGSDVLGSATHTDQGVLEALAARGLDAPTSLRLRAGDVEVHHPNLVHKSEPNRSDRRRCALTLRYLHLAAHRVLGPGAPRDDDARRSGHGHQHVPIVAHLPGRPRHAVSRRGRMECEPPHRHRRVRGVVCTHRPCGHGPRARS